jgi:hypothetical protein
MNTWIGVIVLRPISSSARTVSLESSREENGTLSEEDEPDSVAIAVNGKVEFLDDRKMLLTSTSKQGAELGNWVIVKNTVRKAE